MGYKYFNSIKVRLELDSPRKILLNVFGFQFHKGTIRTHNHSECYMLDTYFNSIKVRLERLIGGGGCILLADFNSIKVRLERLYA